MLQFHKYAVVHDPDDFALDLSAGGIFLGRSHPGIGHQLLQSERYALLFLVKLQDNDVEFLVRLHHIGRMLHAAPTHVGQVQQAVDSAEVDERAVLSHVFDVAVHDLPFAQRFHQCGALGVQFFLQ